MGEFGSDSARDDVIIVRGVPRRDPFVDPGVQQTLRDIVDHQLNNLRIRFLYVSQGAPEGRRNGDDENDNQLQCKSGVVAVGNGVRLYGELTTYGGGLVMTGGAVTAAIGAPIPEPFIESAGLSAFAFGAQTAGYGTAIEFVGALTQGFGQNGVIGMYQASRSFAASEAQGRLLRRLGPVGKLVNNSLNSQDTAQNVLAPELTTPIACD